MEEGLKLNKLKIAVIGIGMLMLAGCSSSGFSSDSSSKSGYQVTGPSSNGNYQGVIEHGHYLTSKSRGVVLTKDSQNLLNLKSFQQGMLNVSKKEFSPNKYIFQEGQYLTKSTVLDWLGRESAANPSGLNPKANKSKDPKKRNPMYVEAIQEQDYMRQTHSNKLGLAGMTIGIAMNRKDYYQKEQYGPTFISNISYDKMVEEGKIAAAKVLERVRKIKGVDQNTPIVIAMFEQAPRDSLVGGNVYAYTVSNYGSKIGSWKQTNLQSVVFPLTGKEKAPNDNDADSFVNFQNKVQDFFPNLAGITAQAQYQGNTLQGLNVNITTQFYSETEIISFTQYVASAAKSYLPNNVPLTIQIKGSDGQIQSFVAHDNRGADYYTHVFGSY